MALHSKPSEETDLEVICEAQGQLPHASATRKSVPHSVTMFLCPCEMDLRTAISFRIWTGQKRSVTARCNTAVSERESHNNFPNPVPEATALNKPSPAHKVVEPIVPCEIVPILLVQRSRGGSATRLERNPREPSSQELALSGTISLDSSPPRSHL